MDVTGRIDLIIYLSDFEQKLNELNRDLYVFEGDLVRLAKWINKNFPQSKIFLNQSTDIGYYNKYASFQMII